LYLLGATKKLVFRAITRTTRPLRTVLARKVRALPSTPCWWGYERSTRKRVAVENSRLFLEPKQRGKLALRVTTKDTNWYSTALPLCVTLKKEFVGR
jgi:hypothetical protein